MQQTKAVHYPYQQRSRMTTGQRRAWDRSWERGGADVGDLPDGPLDTAGWFGRAAPVVLEIGSGMGESTVALASAEPDVDHLAVEVYRPGLAQLLLRIEQPAYILVQRLFGKIRLHRLDRIDEHDAQTRHTHHLRKEARSFVAGDVLQRVQ